MNGLKDSLRSTIGTNKRGVVIYAIGIIAFVLAAVSLVFALNDFYVLFKAAGMNFQSLAFANVVSVGIELAFSVLEITTGISLIKQWRAGESIEIHKTVAKLMKVVIYEGFIASLSAEVFSYFMSNGSITFGLRMVYIGAYLIYYLVTAPMSTYVKRNELMKLYYLMMISAFISVGFSVGETCTAILEHSYLEMGFGLGNVVLTSLIFAFALSTVIYYVKNPDKLRQDIEASEDSELIRETDTHRYLRIYSNRADETGVNLAINILYVIGVVLGCVALVFFLIEQDVARFAGGTLGEVIDNIRREFVSANISSITNLMLVFYVLLIYPISYIAVGLAIILRDSRSKISLVTLSTVGTSIMILSNAFFIIEFVLEFFKYKSLDLETIPISKLALIVLFVVYYIASKFRKNKNSDLFEGIADGDSYRSHIKEIHSTILFNGIFSFASLALMIYSGVEIGTVYISYPFFAASIALILVGTHLELKHPFAEYATVKRRKIKTESKKSV